VGLVEWGVDFGVERVLTTLASLGRRRRESMGSLHDSVSSSGLEDSGI